MSKGVKLIGVLDGHYGISTVMTQSCLCMFCCLYRLPFEIWCSFGRILCCQDFCFFGCQQILFCCLAFVSDGIRYNKIIGFTP